MALLALTRYRPWHYFGVILDKESNERVIFYLGPSIMGGATLTFWIFIDFGTSKVFYGVIFDAGSFDVVIFTWDLALWMVPPSLFGFSLVSVL